MTDDRSRAPRQRLRATRNGRSFGLLLGLLCAGIHAAPAGASQSGADADSTNAPLGRQAHPEAEVAEEGLSRPIPASQVERARSQGLGASPVRTLGRVDVEGALVELARSAGDFGRLETIGESGAGHPIQVLTLNAGSALATDEVSPEGPGLLLVDASRMGSSLGAEAILALGQWIVANQGEPELADLLASHVIHLAPLLDPDHRDRHEASGGRDGRGFTSFDLNFPSGWLPDSIRPGSGNYPLSEPNALAIVEWLRAHREVALVLSVRPGRPGRHGPDDAPQLYSGAELPEADRIVFEELTRATRDSAALAGWDRLGSPGGGLLDHAYQALGIFPMAWETPPANSDEVERSLWMQSLIRSLPVLLRSLPRVGIEPRACEELAPGLWQLDFEVHNGGTLPTSSALAGARRIPREFELEVEGALLVASAERNSTTGPYRVTHFRASRDGSESANGDPGGLGGGETRWIRLLLEGPRGSEVEVTMRASRAGGAHLRITLE